MSNYASDSAKLIDMLPTKDQRFAYEFIKKLVLACDPDYTRVTQDEANRIKAALEGGFVSENEVDWNEIGS